MKNLDLLIRDEFRGFFKSKVIIALWVGLPILTIILHLIQPEVEGFPLTIFVGLLIASIGGLLGAVMLSTTMVNELNAKVYDLFLIRPVKRWHILFAKYVAMLCSLVIATLLCFALALVIDSITIGVPAKEAILEVLKSLGMSVVAMSISCAMGLLIGILVKSVALAAILAIYLGEQLSIVAVLPGVLLEGNKFFSLSIGGGVVVAAIALTVTMIIFKRKQF